MANRLSFHSLSRTCYTPQRRARHIEWEEDEETKRTNEFGLSCAWMETINFLGIGMCDIRDCWRCDAMCQVSCVVSQSSIQRNGRSEQKFLCVTSVMWKQRRRKSFQSEKLDPENSASTAIGQDNRILWLILVSRVSSVNFHIQINQSEPIVNAVSAFVHLSFYLRWCWLRWQQHARQTTQTQIDLIFRATKYSKNHATKAMTHTGKRECFKMK